MFTVHPHGTTFSLIIFVSVELGYISLRKSRLNFVGEKFDYFCSMPHLVKWQSQIATPRTTASPMKETKFVKFWSFPLHAPQGADIKKNSEDKQDINVFFICTHCLFPLDCHHCLAYNSLGFFSTSPGSQVLLGTVHFLRGRGGWWVFWTVIKKLHGPPLSQ